VFLITTLVMFFGLSMATPSASAGPLITGTGAISEALAEVKILLNWVNTIQGTLARINDRFENLEDGLHDLFAEAINRLEACDEFELPVCVHEVQLLLEQAQRDKAMIIVVMIEEFLDFLHEFEVELGELEGKIGGLKEIGKIKVSDAIFMEVKLNSCNKIVTLIDSEAAELSAYLEDGDDGEDPEDFDPETNGADDVNDFIALALKGLRGEEQLEFVIWAIVNAQAVLDQAQAVKHDIERIKVPTCRSALKQVEKRLKKISKWNKVTPILSELGTTEARVYTLSGQLVSVGAASALDRNSLSNGVYVVVYSTGRVEKLVVLH
jgi:hypothetical protein